MILPLVLVAVFTAVGLLVNLAARFWPVAVYHALVVPPLVLLRGPQPDRSPRVLGILLVVVGFVFDLLAT
ncbi:hypothetical protein [Umezawaea tangerina]|uniref:hypothetical protein n=1 Tax=Umezawaea tangerina TaxID=84725 RepID=UPI000D080C3D|nr:hypothetical protein [Umezawaea tangerina]